MAFNFGFKLVNQYAKFIDPQKVIMVTGSIDKSATIDACRAVLGQIGNIFSSQESILDSPQILVKFTPKTVRGIIKLSIKQLDDAKRAASLIKSECLIMTQVLADEELIEDLLIEEYSNLIAQQARNGVVIVNYDDLLSRKLAQNASCEVIFYGTNPKKCHIWAGNFQLSKFRVIFELNYGVERVEIVTNCISKSQIYPILAAAVLGVKEGLRLTQIKTAVEKIYPHPHKMQVLSGYNGSTIIDDSFEGVISTTEELIETLNYIQAKKRIVVLGSLAGAKKNYQQIAQKIYQDNVDLVFLGKGEIELVAQELLDLGFSADHLNFNLANPQIVVGLLKVLTRGDVVLIKGMKESRLDEVVGKVTKIQN